MYLEQVVKACLGDLHKVKKGWAVECPLCGKEHLKQNFFNIAMANLWELRSVHSSSNGRRGAESGREQKSE
jgi:hypothetical protein